MKKFQAPDGTWWGVEVKMPTHSGALVIFLHPDGDTARHNRYAWINSSRPEASDPRSVLPVRSAADALTENEMARLFRRSMPIESSRPSWVVS
ncbi:MAG: hypothetical protein ACT4OZ_17985 [Gemmatimonadota bacterium]